MNRRSFLKMLGLGTTALVAGAELDLERLLWVPKPMVTVPDMAGAVARGNAFVTPEWLVSEMRRLAEDNYLRASTVYRPYDPEWPKVGDTVTVRLPQRYQVSRG